MKHRNGFVYLDYALSDCWGFATPQHVQWMLTQKANARNPALLDMERTGPQTWDRKNKALCAEVDKAIIARVPRLQARLHRLHAYVSQCNRDHLATLAPEQAQAAFDDYQATGLNGGSWGCLKWFEVLPPGITQQAACDATEQRFHADHGWHQEGKRSVKRSETFTPGESKTRKNVMVASKI